MAPKATMGFEWSCIILSYDGGNAPNSIHHHRTMSALVKTIVSVEPYATN